MSGRGKGGKGLGGEMQEQESIYDLIPPPEPVAEKRRRYKSKYPSDTPPTGSTFGRSSATAVMTTNLAGDYEFDPTNHQWKRGGSNFGNNTEHYSDPTNYKKKQTKKPLPEPQKFTRSRTTRKPPVVKQEEKPQYGLRSDTNFVQSNRMSAIMAEPAVKSAEDPNYLTKKDYGKVPKYLEKNKKEIQGEQEYIQQCLQAEQAYYQQGQPQMELMVESDRQELLINLKKKWEQVNEAYQKHTHVLKLDTVGRKRRKEEHEAQLYQLEKAIEKISKPFVFVQAEQQYQW
jgi:hypothetical protein